MSQERVVEAQLDVEQHTLNSADLLFDATALDGAALEVVHSGTRWGRAEPGAVRTLMSMLSSETPCCEMMGEQLNQACEQHSDPFECADVLVGMFSDGRVGLIVHDGGSSVVLIAFCPWCATPTGTTLDD